MAESMVLNAEARALPDGYLDPPAPSANGSSSSLVVQRRVDFNPARKAFNGFSNGGGDFRLETLNPISESKRPSTNSDQSAKCRRRHDGSDFMENGLDPELSLGITVRRIGAGLENLGNTCFLNSVLQCLTHTEPLAAYLQSGKHQNSCKVAGFCALCAIQKHVSRALQSTGRILAPKDLVSNLRCISRNFRNARQEDAHEYMVNLLESMHKCCLPSGVPSESPSAYDKSLVHKIFGGRLRSQVKCMQCNYCSNTFDPFLDLSLEIVKADSLYKALANFTAAEQLDGGERQYQCQKCRQKVRALKQLTVHKAPYVLTVHLKRFRAYNPGQKIDKKVQFGPTLDLKPFVSGSYEGDLKYTLYGVLVHCGYSTHSGHYYSYVRTSGGTWYNLDDNRVVAVGERTVMEQKAYMLFYVRDRRNNAPRKSVDVQKENMKANNGGNKTLFTSKQGYGGPVQNGIVENRVNGLACSATQKDAFNVGPTKLGYNGPAQNGAVNNKSKGTSSSSVLSQKDCQDALVAGSTNKSCNELIQLNIVENGTHGVDCFTTKKDASNVDNRTNGAADSAAPSQKDGLSVGLIKESPLQNDGLILAERSKSKKDAVAVSSLETPVEPSSEPSSEAGLSKDMSKGISLPNSNLPKQFQQTESVCDPNPADVVGTTAGKSQKDLLVSVDVFPGSCKPPKSTTDKLPNEETSLKNYSVSTVAASSRAPSVVPSDKILKNDPVRLPDQPSRDKSQVGYLNDGAANVSLIGKAGVTGQRLTHIGSMEQSGSLITTNESLSKEAHSSRSKKKMRKLRKFHVASMRLGPNILFGALGLQKKKFKKRKHHGLDSKNISKEHLLASNCVSSDVGPSTSDKTRRISLRASRVEKKAAKSASKGVDFAAYIDDDEKCRARSGQNGAVLTADKQSEKASTSCAERKRPNGRDSGNLKSSERETMQNGIMSMLTRGLEETYVARWEETDPSPSQIFTHSKTSESISIGYVGDEWDEEYDMGRRKKVRTFKHSFDGPNLFQEVASKKKHSKKPRMDRSSSGNIPFRI